MIGYAVAYFRDFVRPKKVYRAPDEVERDALHKLEEALASLPAEASAEMAQTLLYDVARPIPRYQNLDAKGATPERPACRDWFNMLYQVLLGENRARVRLFRGALRHRQYAATDRRRAGGKVPQNLESPDPIEARQRIFEGASSSCGSKAPSERSSRAPDRPRRPFGGA